MTAIGIQLESNRNPIGIHKGSKGNSIGIRWGCGLAGPGWLPLAGWDGLAGLGWSGGLGAACDAPAGPGRRPAAGWCTSLLGMMISFGVRIL